MATATVGGDSDERLPLSTILSFAAANLPIAALTVAVLVYLPPYFSGHLQVPMALVGGVWMAIRLIDIPIDVSLALAMDRTQTPFGRYRLWLVGGAPIIMIGLHQLFMAPMRFGALYLTGWLLTLYLGWSMVSLSQSAWGATLARRYHERSRLFGLNTAMGVAATLAVLLIPIFGRTLGRTDTQSIQSMGWTLIVVAPIAIGVTALRTPERTTRRLAKRADAAPIRDYLAVITQPNLLRLLAAQVGLTLGPGWMSALYLFFTKDALGFTVQQASVLLAIYILSGFPGALGVAALARRIGKHRALMVTTTTFSVGLLTTLLVPRGNVAAAITPMLITGATSAGFNLMIQAMLADVGDEIRLVRGQERLSLLYALNGLAQKIATAFSIGLTFPLLARLGYRAAEGSLNTPAAIHNLIVAFIGGPVVFVMLGGACFIGWRLDASHQARTRLALDEREAREAIDTR